MATAKPSRPRHSATAYALKEYTPQRERQGLGLCLSGGGYRATLFHLGVLRRLNELNILGKLRTISSVSGGSIAAAHLATVIAWPLDKPLDYWETRVAEPLRAFTRKNIRTGPIFQRLLPRHWFKPSTAVAALAERYERELTGLRLEKLPPQPNFVLCATDMAFGIDWIFTREKMGSALPGYIKPVPPDWPLARSVAASSCFPPIFNPLPMPFSPAEYKGGLLQPGPERDKPLADLRLTDGGVYDNLGLEPVWKDHAQVLVSDGGAIFHYEGDKSLIWRLQRYVAINGAQALSLRKRWLISNFISGEMQGAYWGIGSARNSYNRNDTLGYSKELASKIIANIRTDLDAFSEAEIAVLENHGYLLADAAVQKHLPRLLPSPVPPLSVPHPEWLDHGKVRLALAASHKRKLFGRW
jgi:NTE family protein